MLTSFSAKNFRCFDEISINNLSRVNLIGGMNNAGKTSLLEALFLHFCWSHPLYAGQVLSLRGVRKYDARAEELWGWLFRNKEMAGSIVLEAGVNEGRDERLLIEVTDKIPHSFFSETTSREGQVSLPGIPLEDMVRPQALHFSFCDSMGSDSNSWLIAYGNKLWPVSQSLFPHPVRLISGGTDNQQESLAKDFSSLKERRSSSEVMEALRLLDKRLRELSILIVNNVPTLCGDMGTGKPVPLPVMGDGIVRVATLALALANCAGGYILIDEFENGLHYSVLKDVWRAVAKAARLWDVQVFATTHSRECIQAAYEAFADEPPYELSYHRLDRVNGDIHVVDYDREAMESAMRFEMEVR